LNLLLNSATMQAKLADDPTVAPHDAVRSPAVGPEPALGAAHLPGHLGVA